MSEPESGSNDNHGVLPMEDNGDVKDAQQSKHVEEVAEKEGLDYYASPEFKARERRVIRKMDFYIAPLMGSFNFIVGLPSLQRRVQN